MVIKWLLSSKTTHLNYSAELWCKVGGRNWAMRQHLQENSLNSFVMQSWKPAFMEWLFRWKYSRAMRKGKANLRILADQFVFLWKFLQGKLMPMNSSNGILERWHLVLKLFVSRLCHIILGMKGHRKTYNIKWLVSDIILFILLKILDY